MSEMAESWEEAAEYLGQRIDEELHLLLRERPAWIQEILPTVDDVPDAQAGETAVSGLAQTMLGQQLAIIERVRSDFPEGPIDPRHPVWRQPLRALAHGFGRRVRIHGDLRGQLIALARNLSKGPAEAKLDLVSEAIILVTAEQTGATDFRSTTLGVHRRDVRPLYDLTPRQYVRWLETRVKAAAEDRLREAYPGGVPDPAASTGRTPLEEVVEAEGDDRVRRIYDAAKSESDRDLLDAIAEHGSIAEAARSIGKSPGAGRQQLKRLRDRMEDSA